MTAAPFQNSLDADAALLVEELVELLQAGESDADEFIANHPEHADTLRRLLPAVRVMANLSQPDEALTLPAGDDHPGEALGDFRLIREVGRGGMGVVYEAEQRSLRRRVALKVLPWAAAMDPKQLQRFKNEALAAASLKHDHIVSVYAVGCERGVHYYAMEFVEGQTLAQFITWRADSRKRPDDVPSPATSPYVDMSPHPRAPDTAPIAALSTQVTGAKGREFHRRAAQLIADAADALEHAHALGIVHRDIKPGNLLLDAAGKLYVSDFGLARFGPDAGLTMSGDLLGTLRYMAPEQALARHGLADHRVDVYGLGCTLYELLTGRPAVGGEDKADIVRRIAFEEPIGLRKIDKAIPAELETITLKCLAKNPNERYATAGELAEDLKRWLGDKTIQARRPGPRQRLEKWVRRHASAVAAASVTLLVGTVVSICLAVWVSMAERKAVGAAALERQAYEIAHNRLTQLEKATHILAQIFNCLNPERFSLVHSSKPLRVQLGQQLEWAARELDISAISDPATVANVKGSLASALTGLGYPEKAIPLHEHVVATNTAIRGPEDPGTLWSKQALANAYEDAGRLEESEAMHQEILRVRMTRLGPEHRDTLNSLNELAIRKRSHGDLDGAVSLFEKLFHQDPNSLALMGNLAVTYGTMGKLDESLRLGNEALNRAKAKLGPEHLMTLDFETGLACVYWGASRLDHAEALLEENLRLRKATFGHEHPKTLLTMMALGGVYGETEKPDRAFPLLNEAIERMKSKFGPEHPHTFECMHCLAITHENAGNLDAAVRVFQEALANQRRKVPCNDLILAEALEGLGRSLQKSNRYAEAEPLLRECLAIREAKTPKHVLTPYVKSLLGASLLSRKEYAEAESLLSQGYDAYKQREAMMPIINRPRRLTEMVEPLVRLYDATGQPDKAKAWRAKLPPPIHKP